MEENIHIGSTIPIAEQDLVSSGGTQQRLQVAAMDENIHFGSSIPIAEQELESSVGTLQRLQAENKQLRILLSCRICRQNRIRCVLQCGHLTCWSCPEPLVNCSICGTPIRNRYGIYLHPPY